MNPRNKIINQYDVMFRTFLLIVLFYVLPFASYSQSLSGGTGLVTIPSAYCPADGEITVGSFYTDKNISIILEANITV